MKYKIGQTVYMVIKLKGERIQKYIPVEYVGETAAGNHYVYISFAKTVKSLSEKQLSANQRKGGNI